jgi:predicted Fe-S protein YdhL (DUF1289 family)
MIDSPCVKICTLDSRAGLCFGCGRSIDEIKRWTTMNAAERARVINELADRLAAVMPAESVNVIGYNP